MIKWNKYNEWNNEFHSGRRIFQEMFITLIHQRSNDMHKDIDD